MGISILLPDYVAMLSFSLILGTYLTVKEAEKQGIPLQKALNAALWAIIFAAIGARLYSLIQNYRFFLAYPIEMFKTWKGGFASFGGFIGGFLGAVLFLRRKRIPVLKFADCCAPAMALGIFFTRIGCFMNGCDFGKISHLPWAVRFPRGSAAYYQHFSQGLIDLTADLSLPVHPTQIYLSANGLGLFLVLIWLRKHRKFDGQLFLLFTLLYSVTRFLLEFFRGDIERGFIGSLSIPQVVSAAIGMVALFSFVLRCKNIRVCKPTVQG